MSLLRSATPGATTQPGRGHAGTIGLIFLYAVVVRVVVALTVPPWQAPDEPKNFEYVQYLVKNYGQLWAERRLPRLADASSRIEAPIIASMVRHHFWSYLGQPTPTPLPTTFIAIWQGASTQLHRPSVYYFLGAAVLYPYRDESLETQLLVVRLLSAVVSALTVIPAYVLAREVAPDDPFVGLVTPAFVATLPMHAFIGGVVNADNLVTLVGSIVMVGVARAMRDSSPRGSWLIVAGGLLLALATKRTAVALVPVVLLAVLVSLRSAPRPSRRALLVLLVGTGLILGVLYVDRFKIYSLVDGLRRSLGAYALNDPNDVERLFHVLIASPGTVEALILLFLWTLLYSFWGIFGWFSVPLSLDLYRLLAGITVVSGIGYVVGLAMSLTRRLRSSGRHLPDLVIVRMACVVAASSAIVLAILERLVYLTVAEVPQGRDLFVVVAPIAAIYTVGIREILGPWGRGSALPTSICIAGLVALDVGVYLTYLRPVYLDRAF